MIEKKQVEDEITPKELVRLFWRGKFVIAGMTALFTCLALFAAVIGTKTYQATIIVSPVTDDSSGSRISSLVSQVGGLASLTGLSGMSSAATAQKSETIAVLQSEAITDRFIQTNNLLPVLFAKKWDPAKNDWKTADPQDVPTLWKANAFFKKRVRYVVLDNKTGLVTVVISWTDPARAAAWANGLVKLTNDFLRDKAISEAERNIAYLGAEAQKTDVLRVKEAIYSILQNEIKKMMLARGSAEYALKIIDPAVAPEKPSSPQPVLWTLIGFFGGLFSGFLIVFIRHWWAT